MKQRAAIYLRISEKDSKVDKVELQEKRLRRVLDREHYTLVDTYPDDGISGYSGKARSGWNALRSDIALNKIDVVLVDRQDRLMRSSMETEVFKVLCKEHKVTWQFADGSKLDPANTMDAAMASFKGIMDQMESDIKKERLRSRFEDETSSGMPLWGVRPYGYRADPNAPVNKYGKQTQRWTLLEPEEAENIRRAYQSILKGGTVYGVLKDWNDRGITTTNAGRLRKKRNSTEKSLVDGKWTYASVQQLLLRPRNAGIVMRNDEEQIGVQASWDTVIDRETYDSVVALIRNPAKRTAPGRKPTHLLSGIVFCGVCGSVMRSSTGNGEPILKCGTKNNAQNLGERHAAIATRLIDPVVIKSVADAFLLGPSNLLPGDEDDLAPVDADLAKIRAARARLVKLITADLISEGDAAKDLKELKAREAELEEKRASLARQSAHASMVIDLRADVFTEGRASFDKASDAHTGLVERFQSLSLEQRRQLVRELLKVTVNPGRSIKRIAIEHLVVESLNDDEFSDN